MKIIVAEKSKIYNDALSTFLNGLGNIEILAICESIESLNSSLTEHEPDVLMINVSAFDNTTFPIIQNIKTQYPNIKIISMTLDDSTVFKDKLIAAGVYKHFSKWNLETELVELLSPCSLSL